MGQDSISEKFLQSGGEGAVKLVKNTGLGKWRDWWEISQLKTGVSEWSELNSVSCRLSVDYLAQVTVISSVKMKTQVFSPTVYSMRSD